MRTCWVARLVTLSAVGCVHSIGNFATNSSCNADQSSPPGDLTQCDNSTLFHVWRPKARFIAPEGWMNDPQALWQRDDGSFHAGYQCHPQHFTWGNISQCAAHSQDLVFWEDMNSWQNPATLYPSQIYDIRGVFDGRVIKNGWQGFPTEIYTSVFTGPLGSGSSPPEQQGAETQSLAYTTDNGQSWIKLNFGAHGNPVIYEWPMQHLTGFRDPYTFESAILEKLLGNSTNATGNNFLTISGGIRTDADPSGGPRLFLYRQTSPDDLRGWTFIGPLISEPAGSSFSPWSGNWGINFETASVTRLNEQGEAFDDGSDEQALNVLGFGSEGGRGGSHEGHWPIWAAVTYSAANGSVVGTVDFAGVIDWGRSYAFENFPVTGNRSIVVGWTYEDDETLALAAQRSYQGALTLFRDLFLKVVRNVDPSFSGLNETGSWTVRKESDGSTSVVTVGQKIIPEILTAYKNGSSVSMPASQSFTGSSGFVPFETQPGDRFYTVSASLEFQGNNGTLPNAGFRVLASDQEWTDIYYDPVNENVVVNRTKNSLIASYGTETEVGKLRLWPIVKGTSSSREALNLTIVVDNSVLEVYANDVTVITTRVYPWLSASKGAGFLVQGGTSGSVTYSAVELWDGLIDAWPKRPADTSKPLLWDGPLPGGAWGNIWAGV